MTQSALAEGERAAAAGWFEKTRRSVGDRWPALRYFSLAFYSAWILLAVTSSEAVSHLDSSTAGSLQGTLYLSSGIALTICLVLAGVLNARVQPLVERGPFVVAMGLLASACTFVLMGGIPLLVSPLAFVVCGVGTGIGTAGVCLRVGLVTSELNGAKAYFTVGTAALVANLLFFMCQAVPPMVALWGISLLPLLAAVTSFSENSSDEYVTDSDDLIDIKSLPKGYFLRLVVAVFTFALAAGVVKGLAVAPEGSESILGGKSSTWEVLISFVVVALGMLAASIALAYRNFEISSLYVPVGFFTVVGILLCPLFGGIVPVQGVIVGILYNVFILMVWCLLIELGGRTTLSPVRVFGFGRGASALATTLGWAVALNVERLFSDLALFYTVFFVVMALAVMLVLVLIFNEQTVSAALQKTVNREVKALGKRTGDASDVDKSPEEDPWTSACRVIAEECKLTAREAEVFSLLSRGRSVSYIADELVIAQSTAKGYTKNVYAKIGVHSRQELIDVTERHIAQLTR